MTLRGQCPRGGGACECLHPPPLQEILYPRLDRDPPPPKKKKLYPISPTAYTHIGGRGQLVSQGSQLRV